MAWPRVLLGRLTSTDEQYTVQNITNQHVGSEMVRNVQKRLETPGGD